MFNSTVKTTRMFWRKRYPELAALMYLRSEESFEITKTRIQRRISQIPKRPGFRHWITAIEAAKRLAKEDAWWYTQIDLEKKLWRKDLLENSNKHRS